MYQLQDLSQGSRIAYIRSFRDFTQAELGIKCGFKPECAGTRIAQYETNAIVVIVGVFAALCVGRFVLAFLQVML